MTAKKSSPVATAKLRTKGSGGLNEVAPGRWKIDIEVGRDPVTKRRRRVARVVTGTREEAEVALARLRIADHERRLPSGTRAKSVGAALDGYIAAIESGFAQLEPKTIVTSRSAARRMGAVALTDGRTFGRIPLSRLTWSDIEALYAAMRASGAGPDWVRRSATVLTQALELARRNGLISTNPAKDAMRPKSRKQKPYSPSSDEVRRLLATAWDTDPEIAVGATVLASTGLRRGELLALRWCEIDWSRAEIHVDKAVTDGGPGVGIVVKATKRSDWRDVPLTRSALDALRSHHELVAKGETRGRDERFVFASDRSGVRPLRPDSFSDRWDRVRGTSSVKLQELRHFAATTMLDAGESYRTVAEILGNSENTLRLHYDGRTDVGKRKAVQALELVHGARRCSPL